MNLDFYELFMLLKQGYRPDTATFSAKIRKKNKDQTLLGFTKS